MRIPHSNIQKLIEIVERLVQTCWTMIFPKPLDEILVIVIGISDYTQNEVAPLPAAEGDAIRFARSLKNWGIPESQMILLLNENGTFEALASILAGLTRFRVKKLIFYFCGHGYRNDEPIPTSYLLFHDQSISLDSILNRIGGLAVLDLYVFIDACGLRMNQIINPKLLEELKGEKVSSKNMVIILSSGIQQSYEDIRENYGYFTEALIDGLSRLKDWEGSLSRLLMHIHKKLEANDLPVPETVAVGNQIISFSDSHLIENKGLIYRPRMVEKIQDALARNRKKVICLVGSEGSGKTSLCQSLVSKKLKTFHLVIPPDGLLCFDHLSQYDEGSLILVDQIERLSIEQLDQLFHVISKLRMQFVFTSREPLESMIDRKYQDQVVYLEMSPFSALEAKEFIQILKPNVSETECELIALLSAGNPLKMKKIVFFEAIASVDSEKEMKKAITALVFCGMYINESLFMKIFDIQEKTLNFLSEIGLITHTEEGSFPHQMMEEIVDIEKWKWNKRLIFDYWVQQLQEQSDHLIGIKNFLILVGFLGYETNIDQQLKKSFQALYRFGKKHIEDLICISKVYETLPNMTDSSLLLAEIFVAWGEHSLAQKLLMKRGTNFFANLCEVQRLRQVGSFSESIALSSEILSKATKLSQIIRSHFQRGLAYMSGGNWDEALSDFQIVYDKTEEQSYLGRAQCMIGTMIGIRGIDLDKGREYLEKSCRLMTEIKDFSGAWCAWNNLGELLWKSGEYKSSAFHLEKALELSHAGSKLETLRNQILLYLYWKGPFSKYVSELLLQIEALLLESGSFIEKAQVFNALSTVYLFRKNAKQALPFLKQAVKMTSGNLEYHTYSLLNLLLLAKIRNIQGKSDPLLKKAMWFAEKGKNRLALHQLKWAHEWVANL